MLSSQGGSIAQHCAEQCEGRRVDVETDWLCRGRNSSTLQIMDESFEGWLWIHSPRRNTDGSLPSSRQSLSFPGLSITRGQAGN
jgi:hypothetical protein